VQDERSAVNRRGALCVVCARDMIAHMDRVEEEPSMARLLAKCLLPAGVLASLVSAQGPLVTLPFPNPYSWSAVASGDVLHALECEAIGGGTFAAKHSRSTDHGRTWSAPILVFAAAAPGAVLYASGQNVYVEQNLSSVAFASSVDGGATWRPLVVVPGTAGATLSCVAVDGASAHLLLESGTRLLHSRSLDGGATWSPSPVPIAFTSTAFQQVLHVVAGSGAVHVVWSDAAGTFVITSLDNGGTWLPPHQVAGALRLGFSSDSSCLRVAVGAVHVTAETSAGVEYNHSLDGGLTWQPASTILAPASATHSLLAEANVVYVTFGDSTQVAVASSVDLGSTWRTAVVSTSGGFPVASSSGPSIGVAWVNQSLHAAMSLDAGLTWSPIATWPWSPSSFAVQQSFAMHMRGSRMFIAFSLRQCWTYPGTNCFYQPSPIDVTIDGGQTWGSIGGYAVGLPQFLDLVDAATLISGANVEIYMPAVIGPTAMLLFGHQPYGSGTAGSGQITPVLHASGEPLIGGAIQFVLTQARGGSIAALGATFAGAATIPLGSSTILLQPPVTPLYGITSGASGQPGAGAMTVPLAIPLLPQFLGTRLNLQGFVLDPVGADGFAASGGVETWIL
jgi:hypothetical protein